MLCVATFRWLCHFAESGYSVFQVPATRILRHPYKILSDSLGSWYPPRVLFNKKAHFLCVFHNIDYEVSVRSCARLCIPKALDFAHPYGGNLVRRQFSKLEERAISMCGHAHRGARIRFLKILIGS
jgi:hypothetical protein